MVNKNNRKHKPFWKITTESEWPRDLTTYPLSKAQESKLFTERHKDTIFIYIHKSIDWLESNVQGRVQLRLQTLSSRLRVGLAGPLCNFYVAKNKLDPVLC